MALSEYMKFNLFGKIFVINYTISFTLIEGWTVCALLDLSDQWGFFKVAKFHMNFKKMNTISFRKNLAARFEFKIDPLHLFHHQKNVKLNVP